MIRANLPTWRLTLLAFVAWTIQGCAFVDRHVELATPSSPVFTVEPSASRTKGIISIARPQDLRPDPTTVGNVRNGYGMVTAAVRSNSDVALWVANSLIAELERAGYRVERIEAAEDSKAPVAIDIAVLQVFCEFTPAFFSIQGHADVGAQVEVYQSGRRMFRRSFAGSYESSNFLITTAATEYQGLLDEALKDFLRKAIPELDRALEEASRQVEN